MMPQNLPVVCAICGRLLRKRRDALGAPASAERPLDRSGGARFRSDPDRRASRSAALRPGRPSGGLRARWPARHSGWFFRFFQKGVTERTERTYLHANKTKSNWGDRMKRIIVSLVATAALAVPVGWASAAGAKNGPDPDANGDVHSNCHTGSKFRGAGGEDRIKAHGNGEAGDCAAAPVPPVTPGAPAAPSAARGAAAGAPVVAPSGAAVPVAAAPRTTG